MSGKQRSIRDQIRQELDSMLDESAEKLDESSEVFICAKCVSFSVMCCVVGLYFCRDKLDWDSKQSASWAGGLCVISVSMS